MNSKLRFLAVLAAGTLLASCGETPNASSSDITSDTGTSDVTSDDSKTSEDSSESDSKTSSDSSSESSSSSSSEIKTYRIVVRSQNGVTIVADKEEAAKGELVTLTVTASSGVTVTEVTLNGDASKLTKVDDTTYTFVMPDTSAVIECRIKVEGDCTISGDIAAALPKQEDDTYKGTVSVENDSTVTLSLLGHVYDMTDVDHDHSFGYYEPGRGNASYVLGGNAIYEISVDPSAAKPVTIYRTGILHAPTDVKEVYQLFNGDFAGRGVLDGGAFYTRNLNHVSYHNFLANDTYTWDLYENNASLGVSVDNLGDESYVYRALKGDEYVVVDNYIEAKKAGDDQRFYDDSVRGDDFVYSGTYRAVDAYDEDTDELASFKVTNTRAKSEIGMPSHNMYGISREIAEGFRYAFDVEDDLVASLVTVDSKENSNGYTVNIGSWKNYDPSASTYEQATKIERYAYDIKIEFNLDSTLKSVEFLGNYYDESNWNFDKNDLKNGGSAKPNTKPLTRRKMNVSYTYGAPKAGSPDFDTAPYFVSSIDEVSITSKNMEKNHVQVGQMIDEAKRPGDDSATSLVSMKTSPATALDAWQYGVVASSDESVISRSSARRYAWEAAKQGSSTVQIGNHLGKNLASVNVSVGNAVKVRDYCVTAPTALGGMDSDYVPTSSKVVMSAGEKIDVYLWATPTESDAAPSVTSSNPNLEVSVSKDRVKPDVVSINGYPTYLLTIDATKMTNTASETVKLSISDPTMDLDFHSDGKVTIPVEVGPTSTMGDSIVGKTYTADLDTTKAKLPNGNSDTSWFVANSTIEFTEEQYVQRDGTKPEGWSKAVLKFGSKTRNLGYKHNPTGTGDFLTFKGDEWDDEDYYGAYHAEEIIKVSIDKSRNAIGILYYVGGYDDYLQEYYEQGVGLGSDGDSDELFQWFILK